MYNFRLFGTDLELGFIDPDYFLPVSELAKQFDYLGLVGEEPKLVTLKLDYFGSECSVSFRLILKNVLSFSGSRFNSIIININFEIINFRSD